MVCGVCEGAEQEVKKVDGVAVVLKHHEERRTTDFIFFLVLILTWVAMTALGAAAGKNGDPNALISPYNDAVRSAIVIVVCVFLPRAYWVDVQMSSNLSHISYPTRVHIYIHVHDTTGTNLWTY